MNLGGDIVKVEQYLFFGIIIHRHSPRLDGPHLNERHLKGGIDDAGDLELDQILPGGARHSTEVEIVSDTIHQGEGRIDDDAQIGRQVRLDAHPLQLPSGEHTIGARLVDVESTAGLLEALRRHQWRLDVLQVLVLLTVLTHLVHNIGTLHKRHSSIKGSSSL